jgi:hypothetical protein
VFRADLGRKPLNDQERASIITFIECGRTVSTPVDEEKFVQVVAAKQSQQRKKSQASLMLQYRIQYN